MARETHNVTVIVGQTSAYTRFMSLLAAVKKMVITIQSEDVLPKTYFVVADRNIKISGFWPALEYILDRYPGDNIQAGWSLEHRAIQRSLTHDLLTTGEISGIFRTTLDRWQAKNGGGFIIEAETPSLVDLAYLSIGSTDDPAIRALRTSLNEYIARTRSAYAA